LKNKKKKAGRKVDNPRLNPAWKLSGNDKLTKIFTADNISDCPLYSGSCRCCRRWASKGYCFDDCKHKDSHNNNWPQEKERAYDAYQKRCRGL
jgi:hypothetical protein